MFKCQICKIQTKAGEGQHKVVTDWRRKTYENEIRREKKTYTVRSEGLEIKREVVACSECSQKVLA